MKKYKLSNKKAINTIASNILQFCINYAWFWVVLVGFDFFIGYINQFLDNENTDYIYRIIRAILGCIMLIVMIVIPLIPKRVTVDNYFVTIRRNFFNLDILPKIWSWQLSYKEIVSCEMYNENYSKSRWVTSGNRFVYYFPNWENVVVITTIYNRNYYVPVKNPEDFICDINSRIHSITDYYFKLKYAEEDE